MHNDTGNPRVEEVHKTSSSPSIIPYAMTDCSAQTKLDSIQTLQTRLSAALEHNCYLGEEFLAHLSMDIEIQLQELRGMLEPTDCSCR